MENSGWLTEGHQWGEDGSRQWNSALSACLKGLEEVTPSFTFVCQPRQPLDWRRKYPELKSTGWRNMHWFSLPWVLNPTCDWLWRFRKKARKVALLVWGILGCRNHVLPHLEKDQCLFKQVGFCICCVQAGEGQYSGQGIREAFWRWLKRLYDKTEPTCKNWKERYLWMERIARQVQRPWGQSKLGLSGDQRIYHHNRRSVGIFTPTGEMRKLRPKTR